MYGEGNIISTGQQVDNWFYGETIYTIVLATIMWKAYIVTDTFTKLTLVAVFGSFAIWIVFLPFYATVAPLLNFSTELRNIVSPLFNAATFWFAVLIIPIFVNLRDFTWKLYLLALTV